MNLKMKKLEVREYNSELDYNFLEREMLLENLISMLQEQKEKGYTHIEIEAVSDYEFPYVSSNVYKKRFETDEEYRTRLEHEKRKQKQIEARDRQELERLKNKYEK